MKRRAGPCDDHLPLHCSPPHISVSFLTLSICLPTTLMNPTRGLELCVIFELVKCHVQLRSDTSAPAQDEIQPFSSWWKVEVGCKVWLWTSRLGTVTSKKSDQEFLTWYWRVLPGVRKVLELLGKCWTTEFCFNSYQPQCLGMVSLLNKQANSVNWPTLCLD